MERIFLRSLAAAAVMLAGLGLAAAVRWLVGW